jgi:cytidylate kinase
MKEKFRLAIDGSPFSSKTKIAQSFAQDCRLAYIDIETISRFAVYCLEKEFVNSLSRVSDLFQNNHCRYVGSYNNGGRIIFGHTSLFGELEDPRIEEIYLDLIRDGENLVDFKGVIETVLAKFNRSICDGRKNCREILPKADLKFYVKTKEEKPEDPSPAGVLLDESTLGPEGAAREMRSVMEKKGFYIPA